MCGTDEVHRRALDDGGRSICSTSTAAWFGQRHGRCKARIILGLLEAFADRRGAMAMKRIRKRRLRQVRPVWQVPGAPGRTHDAVGDWRTARLVIRGRPDGLHGYDLETGEPRWSWIAPDHRLLLAMSRTAVGGVGLAVHADENGPGEWPATCTVTAFSTDDGNVLWSVPYDFSNEPWTYDYDRFSRRHRPRPGPGRRPDARKARGPRTEQREHRLAADSTPERGRASSRSAGTASSRSGSPTATSPSGASTPPRAPSAGKPGRTPAGPSGRSRCCSRIPWPSSVWERDAVG